MSHIDRYYAEESERRGFQLLLYNLEPTGRGKMNEMWRGEKERTQTSSFFFTLLDFDIFFVFVEKQFSAPLDFG